MSIVLLVGTTVFVWFLQKHSKLNEAATYHEALAEINHQELIRLRGEWEKIADDGKEFYEVSHPYTKDLDIFGKQSLFQWLNRTVTPLGRKTLAEWLLKRASYSEIMSRQEAVKELYSNIEYRQNIQAVAKMYTTSKASQTLKPNQLESSLKNTFQEVTQFFSPVYVLISYILPMLFLLSFVLFVFIPKVPFYFPLFCFLLNLSLIGKVSKSITLFLEKIEHQLNHTEVYHQILKYIHHPKEPFQAELLKAFQQQIQEQKAIEHLRALLQILHNLSYRQNALFALTINTMFLLDFHWIRLLKKWHTQHALHWEKWIKIAAETEVICSLSGAWFANPEQTLPTITQNSFVIEGTDIGHPLIPISTRICNEFSLKGNSKSYLLTAPNMAGKSTFLRTLGVNVVLAFAGGSVCAKFFQSSQFDIFTSMRIEDSLADNTSSFYAEIKRIKQLFDFIEDKKEVFYLLDELLRGTNSQDRHEGVKIIIQRLHNTNASGIIATHDLGLVEMQSKFPHFIECYCFDSTITDDTLYFDYKIKKGVSSSFSATTLMKNLGIYQ
jgi:DNA mismatch repair ATPase MutS